MKRGLSILAVLLMLIGCCGCTPAKIVLDTLIGNEQVSEVESLPHIGFSNGEVTDTTYILTVDEVVALPLSYSSYRSSFFYSRLSDTEQTIYHAFEYALENGYANILLDNSLVDDAEHLHNILEYLSLDSPLLEQNLCYELGTFTTYFPVEIFDFYTRNACFEGYYLTVDNFEASLWEKKMQAIDRAETMLDSLALTDTMTDEQKAEAIFRAVADTVVYEKYEDPENATVYPYLYDALLRGKSHCDGFSNALSLLLNMAGLECAEKQYTTEGTDETGHTWDYAKLDGRWVNLDATYEDWIPEEGTPLAGGPGFAFSDIFQQREPDYADLYLPVTWDRLPADAHLSSAEDEGFVEEAVDAYCEHDYSWAYLVVDANPEGAVSKQMQQIANRLQTRIYYASFELMDDRTAILIYNHSLFE